MRLAMWPVGYLLATTTQTQELRIPTSCPSSSPDVFNCGNTCISRMSVQAFLPFLHRSRTPTITDSARTSLRRVGRRNYRTGNNLAHRSTAAASTTMGVIISSSDSGNGLGGGGVCLWLDMRTTILPAQQALRGLYDDLRGREEAKGRTPEDSDWLFKRVPNPVAAVLFADEPVGRAAEEAKALLEGGLRCFMVTASDQVVNLSNDEVVGIMLDPADTPGAQQSGGGAGINAAVAAAAAPSQREGEVVLLAAVRPTSWMDGDVPGVLRITASACAGSGKTLAVTVRSVGQLHDTAMAALAAAQTTILGLSAGEAGGDGGGVALLIEPSVEMWEAGIMYL